MFILINIHAQAHAIHERESDTMDIFDTAIKPPHSPSVLDAVIYIGEEDRSTGSYDEDGALIIVPVYFLVLETSDGARYFDGVSDADCSVIEANLDAVAKAIETGEGLDWEEWGEGSAAYGSQRYQAGGGEAELMDFERRKAEESEDY